MLQETAKGLAHTSGSGQPPSSASLVERPRLLDLVERGAEGPFTLISAPAGSGKTVLLNEWMASAAGAAAIAHVRLSPEHSERRAFWLEVLGAIARARAELSGLAVPGRGRNSLAAIRDAVAKLDAPLRVAVDDFHHVGPGQVMADLEWLVEHAPDQLRLVVATRSDPPIRLQRLRVEGRMAEIRPCVHTGGGERAPGSARTRGRRRRNTLGALGGLGRGAAARGAFASGPP